MLEHNSLLGRIQTCLDMVYMKQSVLISCAPAELNCYNRSAFRFCASDKMCSARVLYLPAPCQKLEPHRLSLSALTHLGKCSKYYCDRKIFITHKLSSISMYLYPDEKLGIVFYLSEVKNSSLHQWCKFCSSLINWEIGKAPCSVST